MRFPPGARSTRTAALMKICVSSVKLNEMTPLQDHCRITAASLQDHCRITTENHREAAGRKGGLQDCACNQRL